MTIDHRDYVYDIESTVNFWCAVFRHRLSRKRWIFEVSDRINNAPEFFYFYQALAQHGCRAIGYNNLAYDSQVVEHLMDIGPQFTALNAYEKTHFLFNSKKQVVHSSMVWNYKQRVKQIDLYKIHHFDNRAKATSLKTIEFNNRSYDIGDLPYEPGKPITPEQMEISIKYCCHDVDETERFADQSAQQIAFREELEDTMKGDVINFNDTKIGKRFFQHKLEEVSPGITGTYEKPRQTHRAWIAINECIFPYVQFETPSLQRTLNYLKATRITETLKPPELADLSATLNDGFTIDFGAGGGHGSLKSRVVAPEPGWKLIDIDVASYYPALAIKNRVYPEHLSEMFCDIYEHLFKERRKHDKKSAINGMLKLALNGVYGDSNQVFSVFYDPKYTMTITFNGQLLLAMIAEWLVNHAGCKIVQLNTDGITVLVPDTNQESFEWLCKAWEDLTGLELEHVEYRKMWIRDVNNYIAQKTDGTNKRIGAYAYERAAENPATREVQWHKNHSSLVVQKAAEARMVDGIDTRTFIMNHLQVDPFDFMLKGKVPGGSRLELVDEHGNTAPLQKVTRYIIANTPYRLEKVMPPLPRKAAEGNTKERRFAINKGWNVWICDSLKDWRPDLVDFDWYVSEAEKLVIV